MLNKTVGLPGKLALKSLILKDFSMCIWERYPGTIYPVLEGYFPPLKGYLFIFSFL